MVVSSLDQGNRLSLKWGQLLKKLGLNQDLFALSELVAHILSLLARYRIIERERYRGLRSLRIARLGVGDCLLVFHIHHTFLRVFSRLVLGLLLSSPSMDD